MVRDYWQDNYPVSAMLEIYWQQICGVVMMLWTRWQQICQVLRRSKPYRLYKQYCLNLLSKDIAREAENVLAYLLMMTSPTDVSTERDQHKAPKRTSTLDKNLFKARIEWPEGQNRHFVPISDWKRLLTPQAIFSQLNRYPEKFPCDKDRATAANYIFRFAPKLFAILICLRLDHRIHEFINEGVNDTHLPLRRSNKRANSFKLCKNGETEPIECMDDWDGNEIASFYRDQWCMLAPTFKYNGSAVSHQELESNCVLPFIKDDELSGKTIEGGYGSVWQIEMHAAHQKLFKGTNFKITPTKLALKRLHAFSEDNFKLEVGAFKHLTHNHLVRLLATYRWQGRYYLIFPWAEFNLRQYWAKTPLPDFSYATVLWALRQFKAIASGLHKIHDYQSTLELNQARFAPQAPGSQTDHLYGRHGDIKPENILWSADYVCNDGQVPNDRGVLLIGDFGLMDFNNKLTRSQVPGDHITGSPTYEPPETKLNKNISRAYDIWSLGCVYLEYITWLVLGWEGLEQFSKKRAGTGDRINDDTFFSIVEGAVSRTPRTAVIRACVREWIESLHEKPRCSEFIHKFLDIVSTAMLVVDAGDRIPCSVLSSELSTMIHIAEEDPSYLIEGRPAKRSLQRIRRANSNAPLSKSSDPTCTEGTPLPKCPSSEGSLANPLDSSPYVTPHV